MVSSMRLVAFIAMLSVLSVASEKPDFSGTWVLDKSRSFSNPPGLDQTITIVHTGDQVKADSKVITAQGERTINEVFNLDGKEAEFTPATGPPGGKGKRRASWLPDGRGILIVDDVTRESPEGAVTDQVSRKWTLSSDGKTLTVDYFFDLPKIGYEA